MPKMTRSHFDFIANELAPYLHWPTAIEEVADKLASTNPRFDREKFIRRATAAWEANYAKPHLDDTVPY